MPPAARVGDDHICPMFDGNKPHKGGPIMAPGCPTVLIGCSPAARVGDLAVCLSPAVDTISMPGAPTVLIGGRPAARKGDGTVHGGRITTGCETVIIGGAAATVPPCGQDAKAAASAGIC